MTIAIDDDLPQAVQAMIDRQRHACSGPWTVSREAVQSLAAAIQDPDPRRWGQQCTAPQTMLSTWTRPARWSPDEALPQKPLQTHYELKELLGYPVAIVSGIESHFHAPVILGATVRSVELLRSVSAEKDTRLGRGRFWSIEVQYHDEAGVLLGIEEYECLGYRRAGEPHA
jgi:hypothetical protein